MKKLLAILLSILFLFGSSGCLFFGDNPYPYRGAYKELYTAAVYSIPNAEGYMHSMLMKWAESGMTIPSTALIQQLKVGFQSPEL